MHLDLKSLTETGFFPIKDEIICNIKGFNEQNFVLYFLITVYNNVYWTILCQNKICLPLKLKKVKIF